MNNNDSDFQVLNMPFFFLPWEKSGKTIIPKTLTFLYNFMYEYREGNRKGKMQKFRKAKIQKCNKCKNVKYFCIFYFQIEFKARHLRNQKQISHYSYYVCILFIS